MATYGYYTCDVTNSNSCHGRWKVETSFDSSTRKITVTATLQLWKTYTRSWNNDESKNFKITIGSKTKYFTVTEVPVASAGNGVNLTYTRTLDANANGSTELYCKVAGSLNGTHYKLLSGGNNDKTITITYAKKTYTVTFKANGGSGAPSAQTKTYGVKLKLSSTVPTRTNYIFQGWGLSSSSTSASYDPGDYYTKNESDTLYAIWKADPPPVVIRYYAGEGHSAPSWQTKTTTNTITLRTGIPIRHGYSFSHWETSSGTRYDPGDTYSGSKSLTLNAEWTPNVTTVKYNKNGGDANTSVPENRTIEGTGYISAGYSPSASAYLRPKKTGYLFKGWSKSSDGSTRTFYNGYPINYLDDGGTITLYAIYVSPAINFNNSGNITANEFVERSGNGIALMEDGIVKVQDFKERSTESNNFTLYNTQIYADKFIER